jgi:selenophosphate synthetase-related protein
MTPTSLVEELHRFPGIRRKQAVGRVLGALGDVWDMGETLMGPGDDAAVIRSRGDGYLLLAADAIVPLLIERNPYQAGRAVVLVNVNDVYAMGGKPLAMVSLLAGLSEEMEQEVCRGMRDECRRLGVPLVGGHVSPEGDSPYVAAGILGEARSLLADRNARPGQAVVLAMDQRGERWGDYLLNWDSHRAKDRETLAADLGVLCVLAEEGLAAAAKDVSNAGIVGTLAMLLEPTRLGACVDLERIRVPSPFTLLEWLKVYPSFGYLLTADMDKVPAVIERFRERGIWAESLGTTDASGVLRLRSGVEEAVFIDFSQRSIFSSHTGETRT